MRSPPPRATAAVVALAVAVTLASARPARAQPAPARAPLAGRVLDAGSGRAVEGAVVTATRADAAAQASAPSVEARTAPDGRWRLDGLAPGRYRVRVRALGYAAAERAVSVSATAADAAAVDVRLRSVPVSLDAVVVTAARREQRLADAVVATEVVGRREIEQSGASDVAAVLTEQTGVQLDAGVPVGAGVQLQGFGGRRVLVLLDGQPLVGRVNGNADLARLPTSMIARIEVVKGPQSTLFGSEAMGGVVNLVTRRAEPGAPPALTLGVVGGSRGRRDADANVMGGAAGGRLTYAADAGRRDVALAPGLPGDDATYARRWNGQGSLDWRADSALTLSAGGFGVRERQRYRTGQLYQFADNDQWSARAGAAWTRGAHRVQPLVYASRFTHRSRGSLGPRPASDSGALDVQELAEFELTYAGPVLGGVADAGVELRQERITADRVPGGRRTLGTAEAYAQLTLPLGPVQLAPGARLTWSEQWGRAVTPRVAALWRPRPALGVRASVARGFRAPDFKELYLEFVNQAAGYAVRGNPDLQPERSTSASASAEWAGARVYARAEAFRTRFDRFIETRAADASGTYTYGNVSAGTAAGGELEAATTAGPARLEAGYAYLHTRDDATGRTLLGRPPHSGHATLSVGRRGWPRASLTALYTATTPVARDSTGVATTVQRPFARLDLRLAHDLSARPLPGDLGVSVGADNLLDRRLGDSWPGFTGRQLYAGVTWRPLPRAWERLGRSAEPLR